MRVMVALAALLIAVPAAAWASGVGTNLNHLPVQAYAGRLAPGERDDYPFASPLRPLCTSGFQIVGPGVLVAVTAPDAGPGDTIVLHTRTPDSPWSRVETPLVGLPPRAVAPTADFVAGCPFFGIEARSASQAVTYAAVTCAVLGPCPAPVG